MLHEQKIFSTGCILCAATAFCLFGQLAFADSFRLAEFQHISFEKIPSTKYSEEAGIINAEVASSSSFLLKPFSEVKNIKKVQWRWKVTGDLNVKSFDELKSKSGDDALFRIGLIKAGSAPTVPFFAPSWIKAIRDHMKLPGAEMQYLVSGGPAAKGAKWVSPYTDSMNLLQVESTPEESGWHLAQHSFSDSLKVVGLWLMADGDNTKSKFSVSVKDLEFTE
jgi:hypothetical protein